MNLTVQRYNSSTESTLGMLFIDCRFECYTLEDEYRTVKLKGETRIPSGKYKVELRKEGGFHNRYLQKFGHTFHKGMLWVRNVPNFEYILIHIGNDDADTAGCLLVGNTANNNNLGKGFIGGSTDAYKKFYPLVADALMKGEDVWIEYKDEGQMDL